MSLTVVATVFAVIFMAELPDKTLFASLVLGTRYRPLHVWVGVCAAFLLHVVLAVGAGSLVRLAPHRLVELVVALAFAAGAGFLLLGSEEEAEEEGLEDADVVPRSRGFWGVAGASFSVVLVAEFGDLTQIATANLAAKYGDPLSVGVGATLGLWAVSGLGILAGSRLLRVVPLELIRRIAGVIMLGLAVLAVVDLLR